MIKIEQATIYPRSSMNLLSLQEIAGLVSTDKAVLNLFRDCALAILNTDSQEDDAARILANYSDFDIQVIPQSRGLKLEIRNAPGQSFVDGVMIRGIQEHLFSALRDIVYTDMKIHSRQFQLDTGTGITDAVFRILRNARMVLPDVPPKLVVCWGGHSIAREEYDYSKEVGFHLGLRGLDIVTGCGIGAMKGPMKGAAVGHAKQQIKDGRYIGVSEPGIIASESPNAIVSELVIMPDIEKRLEAFVRLAHTVVVFPGGVGTVEEIFYLLSILLHPENQRAMPLVFAGPESCRQYFEELNRFLENCLGREATDLYQIFIGDPAEVARAVKAGVEKVHRQRRRKQEAYYFNWNLHIDPMLQMPFVPTHDNMAALNISRELPRHEFASQLRAAFSGLVAGNVKAFGINQITEKGPYQLTGDREILAEMDNLLRSFVRHKRMKLGEGEDRYRPCYELV